MFKVTNKKNRGVRDYTLKHLAKTEAKSQKKPPDLR